MKTVAREQLTAMIRENPGYVQDARQVTSLLRDRCGECKREINVIRQAQDSGVPQDLANHASSNLLSRLAGLTRRLVEEQGIDTETARWAVETWAVALSLISEAELVRLHPSSGTTTTNPSQVAQAPMVPVRHGTLDDAGTRVLPAQTTIVPVRPIVSNNLIVVVTLVGIVLALLGGSYIVNLQSQIARLQADKAATEEAYKLVGTWRRVRSSSVEYKLVTPTRWTYLDIDNSTGEISQAYGGTYTLNGDTFVENTDYKLPNIFVTTGQKEFTFNIEGDTWHHKLKNPPTYTDSQTGETKVNPLGNIDEDWERITP